MHILTYSSMGVRAFRRVTESTFHLLSQQRNVEFINNDAE